MSNFKFRKGCPFFVVPLKYMQKDAVARRLLHAKKTGLQSIAVVIVADELVEVQL